MEEFLTADTIFKLMLIILLLSMLLNFLFAYAIGKKENDNIHLRCTLDVMSKATDYYEAKIALLELKIQKLKEDYDLYDDIDFEESEGQWLEEK